MKNITRYTYEKTAFQGWRLCLSRNKVQYVRYFADKGAGSAEAALAEARRVRQCIWDDLAALPSLDAASVAQVFAKYR
ncbi:MAG: hypothetical protein IKV82_09025 [Akkermansia sp.]|nr:hypothetical protein [Akkermansia sp.]